MRYLPEDQYGFKELEEMRGAPQWMIDCLKLNPSYCGWGNYDLKQTGNRWCDKLTQDEVDYLRDMGQLSQFDHHPTASDVNALYPAGTDAHRDDLIKFRAKKLGIWEMCPVCNGHGYVYTDSEATLRLQLWILHPRNGCSRGVYVRNVAQADLQDIFELLRKADQRNRARFAKV